MAIIPVTRANHLLGFIGLLRSIGTPVDRELSRASLPVYLEETPDAYIKLVFAYRFLMQCSAQEGIDDIGFEAGWTTCLEDLGPELVNAIKTAPTIKTRLEKFNQFASQEANTLSCTLVAEKDDVRICIWEEFPPGVDIRISEWQTIKVVIEIVRSGAGPEWMPSQICLQSAQAVCPGVMDRLGSVSVYVSQPSTSILIPRSLLAALVETSCWGQSQVPEWRSLPSSTLALDSDPNTIVTSEKPEISCNNLNLVESLGLMLKPYISSGYPSIDLAAEIVGTSTRSLQRTLRAYQTSYSELIEQMRFERAAQMLADPNRKIIDVAMQLGYGHSPNFSRAFRRISGQTPGEYRKDCMSG